jgi:hypothetical protein
MTERQVSGPRLLAPPLKPVVRGRTQWISLSGFHLVNFEVFAGQRFVSEPLNLTRYHLFPGVDDEPFS